MIKVIYQVQPFKFILYHGWSEVLCLLNSYKRDHLHKAGPLFLATTYLWKVKISWSVKIWAGMLIILIYRHYQVFFYQNRGHLPVMSDNQFVLVPLPPPRLRKREPFPSKITGKFYRYCTKVQKQFWSPFLDHLKTFGLCKFSIR